MRHTFRKNGFINGKNVHKLQKSYLNLITITQNMKNIKTVGVSSPEDISTITRSANYHLIIVIDKIPENIQISFCVNIAHP